MYAVYKLLNSRHEVVYVGCSGLLLYRLRLHKYKKPWYPEVKEIQFDLWPIKVIALHQERLMIMKYQPIYNIHKKKEIKERGDYVRYREYLQQCEKKKSAMMKLRSKGWTLQKIADKFNLSRQRVHQIINA